MCRFVVPSVNLFCFSNPEIQKIPREIAKLRSLWELKLDDLGNCVREFDPALKKGISEV